MRTERIARSAFTCLAAGSLLLALCGLAACPKDGGQSAGTPPAMPAGSAQTASGQDTSTAGAKDATPDSPAEAPPAAENPEAAKTDSAVAPEEEERELTIGEQERAKEAEKIRPKDTQHLDVIPVDLQFLTAKFNDKPEADLSILGFEFRAQRGRMDDVTAMVELRSASDVKLGVLDCGLCLLEIYPQCQAPDAQISPSGVVQEVRINGRYVFLLRNYAGLQLGGFMISADGKLYPLQPDKWAKNYSAVGDYDAHSQETTLYEVRLSQGPGKEPKAICGVRYEGAGYCTRKVEDPNPKGTTYAYRFPEGRLEIVRPESLE